MDPNAQIAGSNFGALWEVLAALRDHDDILAEELDLLRFNLGRDSANSPRISKLVIDLPEWAGEEFAKAIHLRAVRQVASHFEVGLRELELFVAEHGHTRPTSTHVTERGFALGFWTRNRRSEKRRGLLSDEKVEALETVEGWSWDHKEDPFWKQLELLHEVVAAGAAVPAPKFEINGVRLGNFVDRVRQANKKGTLSPEKAVALETVPGWSWDPRAAAWEAAFELLQDHVAQTGEARPTLGHKAANGFAIGAWVVQQRVVYNKGKLQTSYAQKLEALPRWTWDAKADDTDVFYRAAERYVALHGHARIRTSYLTDGRFEVPGCRLGPWVNMQRSRYRAGQLSEDAAARLARLPGWQWSGSSPWQVRCDELLEWVTLRGAFPSTTSSTKSEASLARWVDRQRVAAATGVLSAEQLAAADVVPGLGIVEQSAGEEAA
jgi:hypothetical protein